MKLKDSCYERETNPHEALKTCANNRFWGIREFSQFLLLAKEILSYPAVCLFLRKTFKSHPGVNVINSKCRDLKCFYKVS